VNGYSTCLDSGTTSHLSIVGVLGLFFWADMALLTSQPLYLASNYCILYIDHFKAVNTWHQLFLRLSLKLTYKCINLLQKSVCVI